MKKVLILTISAGNGHNACSIAMKNKLEEQGDCEVKIVDMLQSYTTKIKGWFSIGGYSLVMSKIPFAYNLFFKSYMKRPQNERYSTASQNTVLSTCEGLLREITEFQPDVIYCTQFYAAMAVTNLKLVYDLPCISVGTTLDYIISPFWESGIGVDYFTIPNEDFIDYAIYKGYKKEQLLPIGLPVDGRSLDKTDKTEARKALGLDGDVFTVMVMFGGGLWNGGYKIFKDLVKALKGRKAQIIMINGKNEESFKKTAKTKLPGDIKVLNVGFTTDVPLYMSAADIILNKFGGTSVTEMINKELPMLIIEKRLAEQEKYNLVYMKEKGVALSFKNAKTLKENVLKLMDDPALRRSMSEKTIPLKKDTTRVLADFILSQPKADYTELLNQNIDFSTVEKTVRKAVKKADKEEKKKPNPKCPK